MLLPYQILCGSQETFSQRGKMELVWSLGSLQEDTFAANVGISNGEILNPVPEVRLGTVCEVVCVSRTKHFEEGGRILAGSCALVVSQRQFVSRKAGCFGEGRQPTQASINTYHPTKNENSIISECYANLEGRRWQIFKRFMKIFWCLNRVIDAGTPTNSPHISHFFSSPHFYYFLCAVESY